MFAELAEHSLSVGPPFRTAVCVTVQGTHIVVNSLGVEAVVLAMSLCLASFVEGQIFFRCMYPCRHRVATKGTHTQGPALLLVSVRQGAD